MIVDGANLLVIFAIAWMMWRREDVLKRIYWPALLAKIIAGMAFGIVYNYYYSTADTIGYYDDGMKLAALAKEDFSGYLNFSYENGDQYAFWEHMSFRDGRAIFFSKVSSVLCLLTGNNFWMMTLYCSLFAFLASVAVVKVVIRLSPTLTVPAIFAFLFCPSFVFWTSGLIKETLAMIAICFIVGLFIRVWMNERIRIVDLFLFVLLSWCLWNVKYYFVAILLPVVTTALFFRWIIFPRLTPRPIVSILMWCVVFAIPLFVVTLIHPNFYADRFLEVMVSNYQEFVEMSSPGEYVEYAGLETTWISVLRNAPKACFAGLFRPLPWETNGILQLIMSLENLLLLMLTLLSLLKIKDAWTSAHRFLIFSSVMYIVGLSVFLALSSPNFGTLVRYRVGFLPFFVLLISINNPFVGWFIAFLERTFSSLGSQKA